MAALYKTGENVPRYENDDKQRKFYIFTIPSHSISWEGSRRSTHMNGFWEIYSIKNSDHPHIKWDDSKENVFRSEELL